MEAFANVDMEDYWNEYRTVRGRRHELRGSHSEEDSRSHEDDVDSDETFLESVLLDGLQGDKEIAEDELTTSRLFNTLNSRQKHQLMRRAEARNLTLRQKRLKAKDHKPNIWNLFSNADNSSTGTRSRSATPDSLDSISPPRTPPDPSPKDWVDSHLSRSRASLDSGHHSLITPPSSAFPHDETCPDPRIRNYQRKERSFSPPTILDKYYYPSDEIHDRMIYRAPSLDILKDHPQPDVIRPKEITVRRQRSYTRDIARDVRHYYSNKGLYEINPSYLTDNLEDIQGLRYQPIGSLHYKSIAKNKKTILQPDHSHQNFIRPSLTRSQSITPKDPFCRSSADPMWDDRDQRTSRPNISCDLGFKIISSDNEDFPELVLEPSRSGRTKITWLDQSALEKLTSLSLLELDIIFSENHIQHSWRKRNRKRRHKEVENGVFGASLETLLEKDRICLPDPFLESNVPLITHKLVQHLEMRGVREEGILRIPGHRAKTDELRKRLDQTFYTTPEAADEAMRQALPNEVAALVKLFLRELPQPLLTHQYANAFYKTHRIPELGERVLALTMLILLLPPAYRDTLKAILDMCANIISQEQHNKMGLYNVAMIMAPNIFLPSLNTKSKANLKADDKGLQLAHEREYAHVTTKLAQTLIKYKEVIWTVPHRLVAQVRRQFDTTPKPSNNKAIHRLLARKNKDLIQRPIANEVDFQNGVMRITATQFNKVNHPVKLTWQMTARDIIQSFIEDESSPSVHRVVGRREQLHKKKNVSQTVTMTTCLLRGSLKYALSTHALHEKGGNIGERRIDHRAELIAVYQDNPNGEFYIKCHHPGGEF